jgi:hypothetical protein
MQMQLAAPRISEKAQRARILAEALSDFRKFCGLLEIQPKGGGGRIRFILSPLQRAYCDARTPRDIILKPRQVYITTLESAYDLWVFLTRPGARVVVVCQSQTDQGPFKDIAEKFRLFFDSLSRAGLRLDFGRQSMGEWTLPKRDSVLRIIQAGASDAAAAKKGRGGTINRLHFTEAAFFEHADVTFNSLLESVPGPEHGSSIINESTPNGVGGFYYEQWQAAVRHQNGYAAHFFRWWEHPEYLVALEPGEIITPRTPLEEKLASQGVTPEQLKWYRRKVAEKGQDLTLQEYPSDPETCFLVSGRPFFDIETTNQLVHQAKPPVRVEQHGALRIFQEPERGAAYVISLDTSEGTSEDGTADKADYSAAPVFNRKSGEHVATLHGRWPPWEAARMVAALGVTYNNALIAVERNNHGHAVLQALDREQKYRNIYRHDDGKAGWPTNVVTRPVMLDALDDAHRQGLFKTPDTLLLGEMRTFVIAPNGRPQAARGAHDDLVMGTAIGWAVRGKPAAPRGMGDRPLIPFG